MFQSAKEKTKIFDPFRVARLIYQLELTIVCKFKDRTASTVRVLLLCHMFSQTNNCYASRLVSKQSKCPGYVSQRRNIRVERIDLNQCGAERVKCGADQLRIMRGGSTGILTDSSYGDANNKERLTVKHPTDGWSTSLEKMPMFTRAEMNEHIARAGKSISDIQNHSVPTSLRKAKTFLEDECLREINAASDDCCFYFQAKCCHSFRKNDCPH